MAGTRQTLTLDGARDEDLAAAATILVGGGTVAFPTETVYGLGARGLDEVAIDRIYEAKGRPPDNPLILHVADLGAALPLWRIEDAATLGRIERLADHFWPGPLTLIAPRSEVVPARATAGLPKVAVRVPAHPVAARLLDLVGEPLAAPSANASGRPSPTLAVHVLESLDGRIDAVVDGGPCRHGLESTVLDVAADPPIVLRPGAVGLEALRVILPGVATRPAGAAAHALDAAPGLRHRHYAPLVDEVALRGGAALEDAWSSADALLVRQGTAARLRASRGARPPLAPTEILPDDPGRFARELYAALYRLERARPRRLVLEEVDEEEGWRAVRDRLLRAAARV